jgi:hypothetical protein
MRRSTSARQLLGALLAGTLLLSTFHSAAVRAAEKQYHRVTIVEPYIELHTGPGRGYPVFHVAERGATIDILRRRTDWFKVRTDDRREGWVHRRQMLLTVQPDGQPTGFQDGTREEFTDHRWEMGLLVGDVDGARVVSSYGAFAFNESLSMEVGGSHIMGRFSNSYLFTGALTHTFAPEWRVSPFFTLGTGLIRVEPKATLVQPEDRTDQVGFAGVGARAYLTRRFMLRLEYKSYLVFTSRNENEEIDLWQGGFAFFF